MLLWDTVKGSPPDFKGPFAPYNGFYSGHSGFYPLYPCQAEVFSGGEVLTETRQYHKKGTKIDI